VVTDEGVAHLAPLVGLERLDLWFTRTTDQGLATRMDVIHKPDTEKVELWERATSLIAVRSAASARVTVSMSRVASRRSWRARKDPPTTIAMCRGPVGGERRSASTWRARWIVSWVK